MDIKQEDEEYLLDFHSQVQIKQFTPNLIEKEEEQVLPRRYEGGCGIELYINNEDFHHNNREVNRIIKREIIERNHWPDKERSDLRRMKIVRGGNNGTNEKGKMIEGDGEVYGMGIKTEAVEKEEYVRCHHCGEQRKTKYELKEHIYGTHISLFMDLQTEHEEGEKKEAKCVFSQNKFQCKASMNLHVKIHTASKPINCDKYVCSSSNRPIITLQNYKEIGKKTYKCTYCEYRTSDRSSLSWHIHSHTGEKPYKCTYCEYRTSNKSHLKPHIFTHTGEKPFNCSYCEFSASDPSSLKRHTRIHTGEKPFKCNICEYSTSDRSALTIHMLRHTGEKPFKCKVCEYRSSNRSHLKTHIRVHTGERPFKCNSCEYSSARKPALMQHLRTHTAEKPFKCYQCVFSASRKSTLTRHIQMHTGVKLYQCNICDYSATKSDYLKKHMSKHL